MYRTALEGILGFHQRGEDLFIEPCIPARWKEFTIEYRFRSSTYEINVKNPDGLERGATELSIDGKPAEKAIRLNDDGTHHRVIVTLRPTSSPVPEKQEKARL
jgi:cyclic beta-1,2-glucan synthetase